MNYSDSLSPTIGHFFDSIVPLKLKQVHLPGLVVLVTNNDSILFAKGYGYANIENKIAVNPVKSVWRLASISKVATATAVMQLVVRFMNFRHLTYAKDCMS